MRLTSRADYKVPADVAFTALSDFDAIEGLAAAAGAQVLGRENGAADGVGRAWHMTVGFKGVQRKVEAAVVSVTPPSQFVIHADSEGILIDLTVQTNSTGTASCEVTYTADVSARGIAGRLLLQPLKLAQAKLDEKFHRRVTGYTQARLTALGSPNA